MILCYKNKGETPLQMLDRLRLEKPVLENEKLSYAGRLDPLAEGLIVVLVGDENKEREKYLGLNKTYIVDILIGVSTDTSDLMGIVKEVKSLKFDNLDLIRKNLVRFAGKFSQKYPSFSSKTFSGKALFQYAREGNFPEISHTVEVFGIDILNFSSISAKELLDKTYKDVFKVSGDFRQDLVLKSFDEKITGEMVFSVLTLKMSVSSGFYVRQFAKDFGQSLGYPALALNIKREKVGDFQIVSL